MTSALLKERRSFYYFTFLVLITAFVFLKQNWHDAFSGGLTMLWGLFGFYRYIYFNTTENSPLPKVLTLPSRILFGLNQQEKSKIDNIVGRFLKFDVLFFLLVGVIFIVWGLYCSLNPASLSFTQMDNEYQRYYAVLQSLSYYFMVLLIVLIAMSYAENSDFSRQLQNIFLPIITILIGYIILFLPSSVIVPSLDFSYLKGMGWGQFKIFEIMEADKPAEFKTGFYYRYIEIGILGAGGLYIIFLPLLFSFVKRLFIPRHKLDYIIAIAFLIVLFFLDFFWLETPLIGALQMLLLAYLACFWRNCSPSTPSP